MILVPASIFAGLDSGSYDGGIKDLVPAPRTKLFARVKSLNHKMHVTTRPGDRGGGARRETRIGEESEERELGGRGAKTRNSGNKCCLL